MSAAGCMVFVDRRLAACVGVLVWGALLAIPASAEPYVPTDRMQVLQRVPAALATRRLEPLRQRLSVQPHDLPVALDLARGYLTIGRETSDPRFISYAQATLSPWSRQADPPAAVLVLSATALQSIHQFDPALSLLDRALALEPGNAQAWLTKATLLQVQGKLAPARAACIRLARITDPLIALTCIANVDGYNGKLAPSYERLRGFFSIDRGVDDDLRAWVLGVLGEMAVRLGRYADAEAQFKAALQAMPEDVYLKAVYADLLLLTDRNREALDLLKDGEAQDVLLLRLAIASRRLGSDEAPRLAQLFEARRRAARTDDNTHLREHARFLLEVRDVPTQALELARRNWQVQREPADVRIYLQAARAARQPRAAAVVQEWIHQTGYEDHVLAAALTGADTPRIAAARLR
jgi:tetratricopeptide (TPR) repeat protein